MGQTVVDFEVELQNFFLPPTGSCVVYPLVWPNLQEWRMNSDIIKMVIYNIRMPPPEFYFKYFVLVVRNVGRVAERKSCDQLHLDISNAT